MKLLRKIWIFLLEILFPPLCLNCKKYLTEVEKNELEFLCSDCLQAITINRIVFRPHKNLLLLAATSYEDKIVRNLVHYFKYNRFLALERLMAKILIEYLEAVRFPLQKYLLIPIPLHPQRYRSRGFNQAEALAQIVSREYQLEINNQILRRVKNNKPQVGLKTYEERAENVKNSFEIISDNKAKIKNQPLLLIDDVYTSGATINEAVKILRRSGAKEIVALVLAKAG